VILIGTGSEVATCLTARERLEADGVPTRVVSMPCQEWFFAQDEAYRERVLPRSVRARVSVEAGIAMSWDRLVGDHGESVSIEHFGASAPYQVLFEQFGFTPDRVIAAARAALSRVGAIQGSTTGN
jgi:transketolase